MQTLYKNIPLKEKTTLLNQMHGHDLKDLYFEIDDELKLEMIEILNDETLADFLSYLDPEEASKIVLSLDQKTMKSVVNQLETDDAIDILNELEVKDQNSILNLIDDQDVKTSLAYDEDSAAGHMTLDIITLLPSMDVKEATRKLIKEAPDVESIQTLFVVDMENYYLGTVHLKKLIKAKSPMLVSEIMSKTPSVLQDDLMQNVAHMMDDYALYEIAVVDSEEKLLGMITLDDALEHYQEEAIEDFKKLTTINDELDSPPRKSALARLPWLSLLLILSIPITLLSSGFESVLLGVAILALFQPLILDASGDVATQSLAVSLRLLNKNPKALKKNGIYEMITGTINGLIMAILAFAIVFILAYFMNFGQYPPLLIAITVSISLFLTVVFGQSIGFFIPILMSKLKIDPAAASGPLITTLADLFSIFFFFGLASIILGV